MTATAAQRWSEMDRRDKPALVCLAPEEPGDHAYHRDELQAYWPFVGAEAWALGVECALGGELE